VLYGLLGYVTSTRRFEIVLWSVLLGSAAFVSLALVGTNWGQKVPLLERIGAWLPAAIRGLPGAADGFHPAEVGGTLTWLIFLPIAVVIGTWPTQWRVRHILGTLFSLGLTALMLFVLLLTQSRSAWLGVAVGAGSFLLLAGRVGRFILVMGLAAMVIAVVALGPDRIADKLTQPPSAEVGKVFEPSLAGRIEIWSRATYGLEDFSFTGMGLGTFRYVVRVLYPLFSFAPDIDIGHAHNEFLQAGVDLGLPGLIAFAALQLLAVGSAWRAYRGHLPKLIHWAAIGVLTGLVSHTVFGLTDAVALGAKPGLVWWVLLGLSVLGWQSKQLAGRELSTTQPVREVDISVAVTSS
jgi:putative inorganic carbon (HCO3(-)) transporter